MAKRFTDTAIWEKEWFMKLSPKHKCLFRYLVDRCDACGVWEPNWHLATIYIGEKVDVSDLMVMAEQVEKIPNGKYFIVGFVQFQYGELSEKCKPHLKVISLLKKHKLFERVCKGYTNPIHRVEEEDKEKEEEKDKEEEEEKYITVENEKVFDVTPLLLTYEPALNARQKEQGTMNWRTLLPKWFETNLNLDFKDKQHVFNSFSKYLMSPAGKPPVTTIRRKTFEEFNRGKQ